MEVSTNPDSPEYNAMPMLHSARLPYGFARRYGVFLAPDGQHQLTLYHHAGLLAEVLGEVRRFSGMPFSCQRLEQDDFDQAMGKHYEGNSGDAMQAAEDLGEDIDLTTLAESLPETADLLEQQDDAPVIRLINAILAEAVKQNASDVHIETYDKRLAVRARVDGMLQEILQPRRELAPASESCCVCSTNKPVVCNWIVLAWPRAICSASGKCWPDRTVSCW